MTIPQHIALWRERGLEVDENRAARFLYDANYYRVSGYARYFQVDPGNGDNDFRPGATFDDIERTYNFDSELLKYLFDGLADLEVALRSRLAYQIATRYDSPVAYLEPDLYRAETTYRGTDLRAELLDDINRDVGRSKESFVQHHIRRGEPVPVWAAVETFSFGTTSKLFNLIDNPELADAIAKSFGLVRSIAPGTFHSLAVLRNICAHHGRIWNRVPARAVPIKQALRPQMEGAVDRSAWAWIVVLRDLVDAVRRDDTFSGDVDAYLERFGDLFPGLKRPRDT